MTTRTNRLKRTLFIRTLAISLATSVSTLAVTPALAQNSVPMALNIPAQPASDAIRALARQTRTQILFDNDRLRRVRSRSVNNVLTARQALGIMLEGSGFEVADTPSGALVIRPTRAASAAANSATPRSGEAQAGSAAADSESADAGATPEILVIGSRSQNVDIRRRRDDAQPYVVFSREEIDRSQATTLEDLFRSRLPMNAQATAGDPRQNNQISPENGYLNNNLSNINLRGLGTNQTLILIDGRPAPRINNASAEFTQADINGIPLSAIERIEVLPTTAGGIFGGGAIGGVINIIRRRDYNGIDARLTYGGTFRGGGENYRADLNGGISLNQGRTQISFSGSYADSRPLYDSDNDLWRRGRQLLYANAPGSRFIGYTPNIFGLPASQNLVLRNGTSLGSFFVTIPVGYAGITSDGGLALSSTAGQSNIDLSNDNRGTRGTLRNNPTVYSGNINIRQDISHDFSAFLDLSVIDNIGHSFYVGQPQVLLAANAPGNPFRQRVLVILPYPGLSPQPVSSSSLTLNGAGGLIARLGGTWTATAEYSWGESRFRTAYTSSSLTPAFLADVTSGAVNVFRDLNAYPIDYTPYLVRGPDTEFGPFVTIEQRTSARASGSLFRLWGGDVTATTLVEYRTEMARRATLTAPTFVVVDPRASQHVISGYSELAAPIVSPHNHVPLVYTLDIRASLRHDDYRTSSGDVLFLAPGGPITDVAASASRTQSTNFTVAAKWAPVRDLSFRGSYATGFLPPSISQIVSLPVAGDLGAPDPRRGGESLGEVVPYEDLTNGNPHLRPERSRSYSLGAILTPRFLPGLRLSIDYTRIRKKDEISETSEEFILANEGNLPGRIVRSAPLPGDVPGEPGPVTFIDLTLLNLAKSSVSSWDFQADYEFNTSVGNFRFYALGSHATQFLREDFLNGNRYDVVGFYDGVLSWRGNVGLDWERGRWGAGWNIQYYSSYSLRSANPLGLFGSVTRVTNQGGVERIPSQSYQDLYIRYRFGGHAGSVLSNLEIFAGIENVFDRRPPAIASLTDGYSAYGDPRLRRFTFSLRKHFGS